MTDLSDIYPLHESGPWTFAEPISDTPYSDVFTTTERATRLAGNIVSGAAAREEVYDRRIEAARQVTGVTLEHPDRFGYLREANNQLQEAMRNGDLSPIDYNAALGPMQRRIFDQKMAELQHKHPELEFGGIEEEAQALGTQAAEEGRRDVAGGNAVGRAIAGFAGGMWGSRRDPLFLGSLFAGPTTAVGRAALTRVASSALNQGLFNVGVAALEKPLVADWHRKIEEDSGLILSPAEVGVAFLSGAIPGAAITGVHEGLKAAAPSILRVLRGQPEPGDVAKATEALRPAATPPAMTPEEVVAGAKSAEERAAEPTLQERTMQAGEESLAADKVALDEKPPEPVPEDLHNDLVAAALKRADDPEAPSPQAVAAVDAFKPRTGPPEPIISPELQDRIVQANPRTPQEAMAAADQALDDFGRRDGMAALKQRMQEARDAQDETTEEWLSNQEREKPRLRDVRNKVPMVDRAGNTVLRSERAVRSDGDAEEILSDLIRSCK